MLSTKSVDNLQKVFFDACPNRSKSLQIWACEGNRAYGKFNKLCVKNFDTPINSNKED